MASGVHGGGGGVCGRRGGGHAWQGRGHAWQERWPLQRAVRILLECILFIDARLLDTKIKYKCNLYAKVNYLIFGNASHSVE